MRPSVFVSERLCLLVDCLNAHLMRIIAVNLPTRLLLLALPLIAGLQVKAQPLPFETIAEVTVGAMPESVIGDEHFLYASNLGTGSNPLGKDGNGYISKFSYAGELLEQQFISLAGQLDGPTGMALLGDRLFVSDLDEVIGFDLNRAAAPVRIDLRGQRVTFLNDLVAVSDHQLVVSATNAKKLFLIDTLTESFEPFGLDFALNHPNGLAFDAEANKLYVAANRVHTIGSNMSNGEVLVLDLDLDNASATLDAQVANAGFFLDGISLFDNGQIVYSDWVSGSGATGVLRRFDAQSLTLATPTNLQLQGFADFFWQDRQRILAAPNLIGGKVRLLRLPIPEPSSHVHLLLLLGSVLGSHSLRTRRWDRRWWFG
jgi:hypothetical protein